MPRVRVGEGNEKPTIAETSVLLFPKGVWDSITPDERKKLLPIVAGVTRCSAKDQFSRKTGRMIATGRAIKAYRHYISNTMAINKGEVLMMNGGGFDLVRFGKCLFDIHVIAHIGRSLWPSQKSDSKGK